MSAFATTRSAATEAPMDAAPFNASHDPRGYPVSMPKAALLTATASARGSQPRYSATAGGGHMVFSQTMPVARGHAGAMPRLPSLPPIAHRPTSQPPPATAASTTTATLFNLGTDLARPTGAAYYPAAGLAPRSSSSAWAQTVPVMARAAPVRGSLVANPHMPAAAAGGGSARSGPRPAARVASNKNSAAVASLRNCHRLQNPNDAFQLRGPVQDVNSADASGTRRGRKGARRLPMSEEEKQVKKARIVRSFLPETLQAKTQQKQAEKEARQERRERHEEKKLKLAEKQEKEEKEKEKLKRQDLRRRIRAHHACQQHSQMSKDSEASSHPDEDENEYGAERPRVKPRGDGKPSARATTRKTPLSQPPQKHRAGRNEKDTQEGAISQWQRVLDEAEVTELEALLAEAGGTLSSSGSSSSSSAVTSRSPSQAASEYSSLSTSTLPPSPSASSSSSDMFLNDNHSDVTEPYEETVEEKKERFEQEMMLFFDTMHHRRMAAASKLQRAFRCHCARQALHARQQLLYSRLYVHQKAAALCVVGFLQSAVQSRRRCEAIAEKQQGHLVRVEQERRQLAAVHILCRAVQNWLRHRRERDRRLKVLGLDWDSRLDDIDRAVLLVQRWWRTVRVQKTYWRRRTREVAEAQAAAAAQARLDKAATSIQRIVRGRQARGALKTRLADERRAAEVLRQRQDASVNVIAHLLREWELREHHRMRRSLQTAAQAEAAAETIQCGWRAALQRRTMACAARRTRRLHETAGTIQRAWRRYDAGRELRYLRQLHITAKTDRCQSERDAYAATLVLQSFARVVLAKADVRRRKATAGRSMLSAFSALQRVGRGALERVTLGRARAQSQRARDEAAETAAHYQAWCHSVLAAFLAGKRSFAEVQRRGRARAAEKTFIRTQVAKALYDEAVAAEQARVREASQRADAEKVAAEDLVRATQYVSSCAVRIQAAWRRYKARTRLLGQAHSQAQWQQTRENWEQVAWALLVDQVQALTTSETEQRACVALEEGEESECLRWWQRHEWRRCAGLFEADSDDDEPPPAAMAAVYARAMHAQAQTKEEAWGALYD